MRTFGMAKGGIFTVTKNRDGLPAPIKQ